MRDSSQSQISDQELHIFIKHSARNDYGCVIYKNKYQSVNRRYLTKGHNFRNYLPKAVLQVGTKT